ncbi:MAG: hypothetical protein MHM6MM_002008 [Cercozoa sp. M6MM]
MGWQSWRRSVKSDFCMEISVWLQTLLLSLVILGIQYAPKTDVLLPTMILVDVACFFLISYAILSPIKHAKRAVRQLLHTAERPPVLQAIPMVAGAAAHLLLLCVVVSAHAGLYRVLQGESVHVVAIPLLLLSAALMLYGVLFVSWTLECCTAGCLLVVYSALTLAGRHSLLPLLALAAACTLYCVALLFVVSFSSHGRLLTVLMTVTFGVFTTALALLHCGSTAQTKTFVTLSAMCLPLAFLALVCAPVQRCGSHAHLWQSRHLHVLHLADAAHTPERTFTEDDERVQRLPAKFTESGSGRRNSKRRSGVLSR